MWLRRLLVNAYGLEETAAHRPGDVAWEELPERCVLQLHWRRTPELVELFDRHGFQVVVLARDPLDVLVSILHFAPQEPQTAEWLDGEAGDESPLFGAEPGSEAFRAYALGPRARALLSVTPEWWPHADGRVRYEELVADTARVLAELADALGAEPDVPVAEAAAAVRFSDLQREATNGHFWQGRAGTGRELIPPELAREIAELDYAV
jgi:hypothetical protein